MDQENARIREPKMTPNRKKLVIPISWKRVFRKGERTLEEKPRERWKIKLLS